MIRRVVIFLFAAALLFFVGCADRECPADRAAREGILLIGNSADPESLDPALATGFSESRILNALFEGLVCADTKTLQVRPAVAKSWTYRRMRPPDSISRRNCAANTGRIAPKR